MHGLFRDPLNKRVMGLVVGTFVYCLVVMRAVRAPIGEGGEATVASLAVLVAVLFGLAAILATVGSISHAAHTMDTSTLLHLVTNEAHDAIAHVDDRENRDSRLDASTSTVDDPPDDAALVRFVDDGCVLHVDRDAMLAALPARATARVATIAGHYAVPGAALAQVWARPDDDHADEVSDGIRRAVGIRFGIRQLADVALKALSPGVNDPTTAQDAVFHMVVVVRDVLEAGLPRREHIGDDGRRLLLTDVRTPTDTIGLAFDEVRLAAVEQPTVLVYLLEAIALLREALAAQVGVREALERQASLVLEVAELWDLPEADRERVREAHRRRYVDP